MQSRQPVIAGLILVGALLSCPAGAEDYVKSYPIAHRADVRVHVDDSSERVITSDAKQVAFRVSYQGTGFNISTQLHIDSKQNGDQVELTEELGQGVNFALGDRRLTTEVHMPRDADLMVEAQNGAVHVS